MKYQPGGKKRFAAKINDESRRLKDDRAPECRKAEMWAETMEDDQARLLIDVRASNIHRLVGAGWGFDRRETLVPILEDTWCWGGQLRKWLDAGAEACPAEDVDVPTLEGVLGADEGAAARWVDNVVSDTIGIDPASPEGDYTAVVNAGTRASALPEGWRRDGGAAYRDVDEHLRAAAHPDGYWVVWDSEHRYHSLKRYDGDACTPDLLSACQAADAKLAELRGEFVWHVHELAWTAAAVSPTGTDHIARVDKLGTGSWLVYTSDGEGSIAAGPESGADGRVVAEAWMRANGYRPAEAS